MDYTKESISFKIKKAFRYIRLYGPRRTYVKIKGQYHMKKRYSALPAFSADSKNDRHVGIIGCGNFAFSNIAYYLNRNYGGVIRGVMDKDIERAASLFQQYGCSYFTDDAEKIIRDEAIDTIFIASNHASHAEYAIKALSVGKNVHIEKPHVVNEEQLERLLDAERSSSGKILSLGYNRPKSAIGQKISSFLSKENGETMLNWFVAGHELDPDHWYFKDEEGGRVLGNLCHWTDFSYNMIDSEDRYPIVITPTRSDKSDCDIAVTYTFGDGSIAAITFSAKGHTFEGVREKLSVHKGNLLISMDDFKKLVVDNMEQRTVVSPMFRDHGHELSICSSYDNSLDPEYSGQPIEYVWESAQLFLKTREALESNRQITISGATDLYSENELAS